MNLGRAEHRPSSRPFLSGDTFRNLAGTIVEAGQVKTNRRGSNKVLFAELATLDVQELLFRAESGAYGRQKGLILHNGDRQLGTEEINQLSRHFSAIFAPNIKSLSDRVRAVPIGLENLSHNKNGKLKYFKPRLTVHERFSIRSRRVLSNYHVGTNQRVRSLAAEAMSFSRHGHMGEFLKTGLYFEEVRRTKFVISPPGNGIDCHRTWEAIYLGAVPVVLTGTLDKALTDSLPILEVQDYRDFSALPDEELDSLYETLTKRPVAMAFLAYWKRLLRELL